MMQEPVYQRVVSVKQNSSCANVNVQLRAAFMRQKHTAAINMELHAAFVLLLTCQSKMYLIGCGKHFLGKHLNHFLI